MVGEKADRIRTLVFTGRVLAAGFGPPRPVERASPGLGSVCPATTQLKPHRSATLFKGCEQFPDGPERGLPSAPRTSSPDVTTTVVMPHAHRVVVRRAESDATSYPAICGRACISAATNRTTDASPVHDGSAAAAPGFLWVGAGAPAVTRCQSPA